jgi:acyl-CoA thioesterase-1
MLTMTAASAAQAAAPSRTILVLGDSLSAGYGIRVEEGWVALLQKRLQAEGYGYRVVNASASGETTSGGLNRLPRAIELHDPAIVVIELGGNDGLRGLPLETTRTNVNRMIDLARNSGAKVLLLGMKLPPNYGPRYTAGFEAVFNDAARRHRLAYVPFFLDGVASEPGMMQPDGLHPTAQAQAVMLDAVWPSLRPLLRKPARKLAAR